MKITPSVQMSVFNKTPKKDTTVETTESRISPELINTVKENAKHFVVLAVAAYASVVVLNTTSTIAINYAPKK